MNKVALVIILALTLTSNVEAAKKGKVKSVKPSSTQGTSVIKKFRITSLSAEDSYGGHTLSRHFKLERLQVTIGMLSMHAFTKGQGDDYGTYIKGMMKKVNIPRTRTVHSVFNTHNLGTLNNLANTVLGTNKSKVVTFNKDKNLKLAITYTLPKKTFTGLGLVYSDTLLRKAKVGVGIRERAITSTHTQAVCMILKKNTKKRTWFVLTFYPTLSPTSCR